MAQIIGPRVEEILELTLNELRRAGYPEQVLTSGIVLTGGASLLRGVVELAEDIFHLPARIGVPQEMGNMSERLRNPRYATVVGLLYAAKNRVQQNGTTMGVSNRRSLTSPKNTSSQDEIQEVENNELFEDEFDRQHDLDLPEPRPRKPNAISRAFNWIKNNL